MYAAEGVSVRIGTRTILEDVDLALSPGRITVVIGPNGAGKSTLLKAMAGERRPAAGSIKLNGRNVYQMRPHDLATGRAVLAQSVSLSAPFTVDEIVRLGIPASVRPDVADLLVLRGLAAIDLPDAGLRPITHLSGGEQQRVHAARVLIQLWSQGDSDDPRYLLLDEPTTHLDPAHQLLLMKLARNHADSGGGVLAILHDLNLAAAVADEIAVLHRGRIVASGPPESVMTEALMSDVYGVAFRAVEVDGRRWVAPHLA
jgi:iron complex transport system ATP-binding protein